MILRLRHPFEFSLFRTLLFAALLSPASRLDGQERLQTYFIKPSVPHSYLLDYTDMQDSLSLSSPRVVESVDKGKSTSLAMLLSAVLPGAGQVYAERYWSIPLIWGFGVYFFSQYKRGDDLYEDFRVQFAASVAADTANHQGDARLLDTRDFYRDERDRFAIYLALTYIVNLVDAYVGAALYGFDVSDNLGGGKAIRFNLRFR